MTLSTAPDAEILLADLNTRHLAMMTRLPEGGVTSDRCDAFIAEIQAAGARIARRRDRDTLRNMLLFWAMERARREEAPSGAGLPVLADFAGAPAQEKADADGPTTAAAAAVSPAGGEPVVTMAPKGPVPQVVWSAGRQITSLARGITAKAIPVSLPVPPPDTGAPTPETSRSAIRFAALARAWRDARPEVRAGLLLADSAIDEAARYADNDPDIRAFVEASRAWQQRRDRFGRQIRYALIGLSVALLVFLGAIVHTRSVNQRIEALNRQLASLNESLETAVQDRTRTADEARRAVDALGEGRIDPLRRLLGRIAEADASELSLLTIERPATAPGATALSNAVRPASRTATSDALQRVAPQAVPCSGALWLGSANGGSRLQNIADPAAVRIGQQVVTVSNSDIRLRADLPAADYTMARQAGLVPGGSTVTVTGPPTAFERRGVNQFWARVTVSRQFCTTVFVQYDGTAARLPEIETALKNLGVQVPRAEAIETARGRAEVRYFWPEDEAVATAIAQALSPFNGGSALGLRPLTAFPNRPAAGTVEVWIGQPS